MKILLAPTYEEAIKISADITIEAEYGSKTVEGKLYTSAHHGKNSNNPAPCNDEKIPTLDYITILLSHLDVDTIIGCGRVYGIITKEWDDFCKAVEIIDVNGTHHMYKLSQENQDRLNAYYAWNFSQGRQERIVETTDVTSKIEESLLVLTKIFNNDENLIKAGKIWVKSATEAVENCLLFETQNVRVFSTSQVFCGAAYYSLIKNKIMLACVSFNQKFKAITLSFEDGGKQFNAVEIMQEIFGNEAGGRPGIAGTPRGIEFTTDDMKNVVDKLIKLGM